MNSNNLSVIDSFWEEPQISYDDWNRALFVKLFATVEPNQSVYLYVNDDLIGDIGEEMFGLEREFAMNSFCLAVQSYHQNKQDLFERAVIRGERWYSQEKDRVPPPFLALLGLCVLAATHMEADKKLQIGGGNYYFRLRSLLGMEGRKMPKKFDQAVLLWELLGKWQNYHQGRYGFTHYFTFDTHVHTGYPRSQCLIRNVELPRLYEFFERMGYSKDKSPSMERLEQELATFLNGRVGRLFDQFTRNKKLRKAIVACVQNELHKWNPMGIDSRHTQSERDRKTFRQRIRLLLSVEESFFSTSVRLLFYVQCLVRNAQVEQTTPFVYRNQAYQYWVRPEDNLLADHEFNLPVLHSRWVYRAKKIFSFMMDHEQGVHDWEENSSIRKDSEHLLLFHESLHAEVNCWVKENDCKVLESYEDAEIELAKEWHLLKVRIPNEINDEQWLVDRGFRVESSRNTSIRVEQGLPFKRDQWLYQEPWPQLVIEGEPRSEILVNGIPTFSIILSRDVVPVNNLFSSPGAYHLEMAYTRSKNIVLREPVVDIKNILNGNLKGITLDTDFGTVDVSGHYLAFHAGYPKFPQLMARDGRTFSMTSRNRSLSRTFQKVDFEQPYARSFRKNNFVLRQGYLSNERSIDKMLEYLTLLGSGSWEIFCIAFERFFEDRPNKELHYIRMNLARLGAVEFQKRPQGGYDWFVVEPVAIFIPSLFSEPFMALSGGRSMQWINQLQDSLQHGVRCEWAVPDSIWEPIAIYFTSDSLDVIEEKLRGFGIRIYETEEYLAHDLVRVLPTLEQMVEQAPECGDLTLSKGSKEGWNHVEHKFQNGFFSRLMKHINPFATIEYTIKHSESSSQRVGMALGLSFIASELQLSILSYSGYRLRIMAPYQLPDLYDRVLTACSGRAPIITAGHWEYHNVPLEVALFVSFKLNLKLQV